MYQNGMSGLREHADNWNFNLSLCLSMIRGAELVVAEARLDQRTEPLRGCRSH